MTFAKGVKRSVFTGSHLIYADLCHVKVRPENQQQTSRAVLIKTLQAAAAAPDLRGCIRFMRDSGIRDVLAGKLGSVGCKIYVSHCHCILEYAFPCNEKGTCSTKRAYTDTVDLHSRKYANGIITIIIATSSHECSAQQSACNAMQIFRGVKLIAPTCIFFFRGGESRRCLRQPLGGAISRKSSFFEYKYFFRRLLS